MTLCRYYLQGNCRFGDRCRFEHSYSPNYSSRRNDYGYQDRSSRQYESNVSYYPRRDYVEHVNYRENDFSYQDRNSHQYDRHVSCDPQTDADSWYGHQHYNYSEQYSTDKAHYKKQHNKNQHESNDSAWHRNSEYGRSSNYYSNRPENSSKEFISRDNRNGHKASIDTSTPKSKVPFSFKDSSPFSKQDSSELNMNEKNMFYADIMRKDAEEWELSNIWPFSSYCPIPTGILEKGGSQSLPGFSDISPEELRYEAYKARENNTLSSYVRFVGNVLSDVKKRRDELKEPSIALMSTIEDFRKGQPSSFGCSSDGEGVFLKLNSDTNQTEVCLDKLQGQQPTIASNFSFKTTLETDSFVKPSATSFSFKLPSSELNSKQTVTDDNYTSLEQLSEEDKEAFLSSTFTLGKIPTVPPPKILC